MSCFATSKHMEHQYLPDIKLEVKSIINTTTNSQTPHKTDTLLSKQNPAATQAGLSLWPEGKQVQGLASQVQEQSTSVGDVFRKAGLNASMDLGIGERWTFIQQFKLCMWKPIVKQHPEINRQQSRLQITLLLLSPHGTLHSQTAAFSKRNSSSLTQKANWPKYRPKFCEIFP